VRRSPCGPAGVSKGTTLHVREQVNPSAKLRPAEFRVEGQFRDIPLPVDVAEPMDKHVVGHGTTSDGYLFQGRRHKHVTRRTYSTIDFDSEGRVLGIEVLGASHALSAETIRGLHS
jgi:hypothetical protein